MTDLSLKRAVYIGSFIERLHELHPQAQVTVSRELPRCVTKLEADFHVDRPMRHVTHGHLVFDDELLYAAFDVGEAARAKANMVSRDLNREIEKRS